MLNEVVDLLKSSNNVAIYVHINTDCDAMGSSLALKLALEDMGKYVDIYANSNFPLAFEFYGDHMKTVNTKTVEGNYDLAVCLDCASEGRLGKYKFTYRKRVENTLNIDHHATNEKYCKVNYIQKASSTCEILFDIMQEMNVRFSPEMCKFLISGIATDTGKFSHAVSTKTFVILSKLLRYGKISIEDITTPLFNSLTAESFNLMKLAYQKIEFYSNKKLAVIMFSREDFIETNTTLDDTDALPDIPMQLKDVCFGILASQDDKGYFRVSFRSKGDVSARAVAETFGGGGHKNASGCKLYGTFDEVKQRLIDSVLQTLGWEKWHL